MLTKYPIPLYRSSYWDDGMWSDSCKTVWHVFSSNTLAMKCRFHFFFWSQLQWHLHCIDEIPNRNAEHFNFHRFKWTERILKDHQIETKRVGPPLTALFWTQNWKRKHWQTTKLHIQRRQPNRVYSWDVGKSSLQKLLWPCIGKKEKRILIHKILKHFPASTKKHRQKAKAKVIVHKKLTSFGRLVQAKCRGFCTLSIVKIIISFRNYFMFANIICIKIIQFNLHIMSECG